MKIAINRCYGGFSLSDAAIEWLRVHGADDAETQKFLAHTDWEGKPYPGIAFRANLGDFGHTCRTNPVLIRLIEELGELANRPQSRLCVVDVPDGIEWELLNYDGTETIHEKHRIWGDDLGPYLTEPPLYQGADGKIYVQRKRENCRRRRPLNAQASARLGVGRLRRVAAQIAGCSRH